MVNGPTRFNWVGSQLPKGFHFAHQFAFDCHDQLARFVRTIEDKGLTQVSFGFVATLFIVQYGASAVAARNNGVRLVCTVLALHSVKRRTS
jgi:hypothetical protein